jgi:LynF/TruF/PatF family peptide O-prenyltransferase
MNPFMQMYNFHRTEFGLDDNPIFYLFEKLILESPSSAFECAPKITPTEIHSGRFRLGYEQRNNREALEAIFHFLQKVAKWDDVHLNREIFNTLVNKRPDFSKIMKMGIGIDNRKEGSDSKVKYYVMIRGYPEKVDQALSLHQHVKDIRNYPIDDVFGFGINMYFDGRTDIEIYPLFTPKEMQDHELIEKLKLREGLTDFAGEYHSLHISFDGRGGRILHFHPKSPNRFVQLLNNHRLIILYSNVKILNYLFSKSDEVEPLRVSFSLIEDEILSGNIENINLQYTLNYRSS